MGAIFGFAILLGGALWDSLLMFSLKLGGGAGVVVVVVTPAGPVLASPLEDDDFSADGWSTTSIICDMHSFTIFSSFIIIADGFTGAGGTNIIQQSCIDSSNFRHFRVVMKAF